MALRRSAGRRLHVVYPLSVGGRLAVTLLSVTPLSEVGIGTWVCGAAVTCRSVMELTQSRKQLTTTGTFYTAERAAITEERG